MTLDTITLPDVLITSCVSHQEWFSSLYEETTEPLRGEQPSQEQQALLQRLVELSSSDDSLDWDALARINIEGWGADPNSGVNALPP